jgi:hypothetical protein
MPFCPGNSENYPNPKPCSQRIFANSITSLKICQGKLYNWRKFANFVILSLPAPQYEERPSRWFRIFKPGNDIIYKTANDMDANKKRDPMPDETADVETIIEFWDMHTTADYEDELEDVDFEMDLQEEIYVVRLIPELADIIGRNAKARGVSTETLVNLWLAEKAGMSMPTK